VSTGYPKTERQASFMAIADELAIRFAERANEHDRAGAFPFENFWELHESGYLGLTIPEAFGGWGANPLEFALAQERLGRGCGSTALAATMHLTLLGRQGEARLWPENIYAGLCRDVLERGALVNSANSEPDLGSPSRGALPSTTAERMASGWVVNGRKRWASLAPALSYVYSLVTVVDGGESPRRGNLLIPTST
jgi:alkylation response protein AidB-like acyl-CoA dehydrogenase